MSLTLDSHTCIQCSRCVRACRRFILEHTANGIYIHADREKSCMHCGQCAAACPTGALALDGHTSKDMLPAVLPAEAQQTLSAILQSRRSCGAFSPRPVSRDEICDILSETRHAPTARNRNSVHWIVADREEIKKSLLKEMMPFYQNSSDPVSHSHYENYLRGKDSILRGAPCLIIACFDKANTWGMADCSTAVAQLQLLLHVRGLASCWAGGLLRPPAPASLCVPEGYAIGAALLVGYPAMEIRRVPFRPDRNITFL